MTSEATRLENEAATFDDAARVATRAEDSAFIRIQAQERRDEAADVLAKAARHGVRVGVAPDTFLGPAVQTASRAIMARAIGEPLSADAACGRAFCARRCMEREPDERDRHRQHA